MVAIFVEGTRKVTNGDSTGRGSLARTIGDSAWLCSCSKITSENPRKSYGLGAPDFSRLSLHFQHFSLSQRISGGGDSER